GLRPPALYVPLPGPGPAPDRRGTGQRHQGPPGVIQERTTETQRAQREGSTERKEGKNRFIAYCLLSVLPSLCALFVSAVRSSLTTRPCTARSFPSAASCPAGRTWTPTASGSAAAWPSRASPSAGTPPSPTTWPSTSTPSAWPRVGLRWS